MAYSGGPWRPQPSPSSFGNHMNGSAMVPFTVTGGGFGSGNSSSGLNHQHILSQATADDLIRTQNPAYISLFTSQIKMQAEIDTQKAFIDSLLQQVRAPVAPPQTTPSDRFVIPTSPALCYKDDFPDVKFWTKDEWRLHKKNCFDRQRDYGKLDFLTNEEGEAVNNTRLAAMSAKARELFTTLYRYKRDPRSWGTRASEESAYFSNYMRADFSEFTWCENDWKVHAFATERYPDWSKDVRGSGNITRANPSFQRRSSKRKNEDESENERERKEKRKKKKSRKDRPAPAAPLDIIDLDGDTPLSQNLPETSRVPARPQPRPRPRTALNLQLETVAIATNTLPPSEELEDGHARTKEKELVLQDTTNGQRATDLMVTTPTTKSTDTAAPSSMGTTAPTSTVTAPTTAVPAIPVTISSTTSPRYQQAEPTTGITPTTAATATPLVQPTQNLAVSSAGAAQTVVPRCNSNLFGGLSIPKPHMEIEQVTTVSVAGPSKRRKGKPMQPTQALTARNLYVIDYVKEHLEITAAEFKTVYDGLGAEVIKKYEELAKARKAEESAAKKSRGSRTVSTT